MVSALIHFLSWGSNLLHLWIFGGGNECSCKTLCNLTPTSFHWCLWGGKKTSPHVTGFAHRGVLLIHYSDCKTPFPTSHTSPVLISSSVPFPPHHEPCSTFGSMPCFLNFWWCVGGWSRARSSTAKGEENCCVSSVMSAVRLQKCHLRKGRQLSVRAHSSLWSRSPGPDIIFDFLFCLLRALSFEVISDLHIVTAHFFYFLHLLEIQYIHINMRAKQMTSRWSQKPVVLQTEHLNDTSL